MMRTALLIATFFFIIILLTFIPYSTIDGDAILIHSEGMLPSLLIFSIICTVMLLAIGALTLFRLKQNLHGQFILKRKDSNLSQQFSVLAFWVAFILFSQFLSKNNFYLITGLTAYFLIILVSFSIYILFQKWYIQKLKPDFLAIADETVYLKSFFGNGKRKIKNIKIISYDIKSNSIVLQFQEGLDNIKLHLTDYKINELQSMLEVINQAKGNTIKFNENLSNFLPK